VRNASGVWRSLAMRVAFVNSLPRGVRRVVHQGLDLGEALGRGAMASIVVVWVVREEENYWSSWLGEGVSAGGGIGYSFRLLARLGRLASCQRGQGLWL